MSSPRSRPVGGGELSGSLKGPQAAPRRNARPGIAALSARTGATPPKPSVGSGSKIFQPTDSVPIRPRVRPRPAIQAAARRGIGAGVEVSGNRSMIATRSRSPYRATRDGSAIDYVLKRPAVLVGSAWPGASKGSVM